jgi:hypothetical protein
VATGTATAAIVSFYVVMYAKDIVKLVRRRRRGDSGEREEERLIRRRKQRLYTEPDTI